MKDSFVEKIKLVGLVTLVIGLIFVIALVWSYPKMSNGGSDSLVDNLLEDGGFSGEEKVSEENQHTEQANRQLLADLENEKVLESIEIEQNKLEQSKLELTKKEKELAERENTMKEEQRQLLAEKEKIKLTKEEAADYEKKLATLASQFTSMPPEQAVERLIAVKDDGLIIDVLNKINEVADESGQNSIVPFFISLMPKEVASRLVEKSVVKF